MLRNILISCAAGLAIATQSCNTSDKIDRHALVTRNNPTVTELDTLASFTVGNGGFAFTVDATGLQTFSEEYSKGVPLGTQSQWGWHSFINKEQYRFEETLREDDMGHGHPEVYSRQIKDSERGKGASDWFRVNPHRLHLGTLGFDISNTSDVKEVRSTLDMWSGTINSSFVFNGEKHAVTTTCHPTADQIAVRVVSKAHTPLIMRLPYPTGAHCDDACDYSKLAAHTSMIVKKDDSSALIVHTLDTTKYYISFRWEGKGNLQAHDVHTYVLTPETDEFKLTCYFGEHKPKEQQSYDWTAKLSAEHWKSFWTDGAAVDFSECTDPRAKELERRVVLSQYLLAAQCAGDTPPQETGLTYNSWFGKFHLEMIYWHQAWLPLWGHPEMLTRTLKWYHKAEPNARYIAQRQGFKGVRWMKMTDPSSIEAPSNVGSYLIWQQPHLIQLAELAYRSKPSKETLDEFYPLICETAEFMADFTTKNNETGKYDIQGFIPAQETLNAKLTRNAPFELSYWHYGLKTAQLWRERENEKRIPLWDEIADNLASLAYNADSLYLAAETATETYNDIRFTSDHPAVLGALGILPKTYQVDERVMLKTLQWVRDNWNWNKTWGWDYPMTAMCATRLGQPEMAIEAILMDNRTNTYLKNGHNFQDQRLRVYLPGNGGLLTTIALMCAGWDGCTVSNPGFPKDGKWNVRWEGLNRLP